MAERQDTGYNTGDEFTDQVLEGSRLRRQTGYGHRTIDQLNTPPLRVRMEGMRESTNTIDERVETIGIPRFDTPMDRALLDELIEQSNPATQWRRTIDETPGFLEDILETLSMMSRPDLYEEGLEMKPTPEELKELDAIREQEERDLK